MLKFRVFDKRYNTYLSPIKVGNMLWDALNSKDYILEQFTGLQDKNGKDIYVGDIVQVDTFYRNGDLNETEIGVCYYKEEWGSYLFKTKDDDCEGFAFINVGYDTENAVVLGNIHENKELLEDDYI